MIRYAAFVCLALAACTPEAKPPETPVAEQATPDVTPQAADAGDAAKYKPAPDGEITVQTPLAGARVTSPLIAKGVAINTWFFEGQFVAELVVDGEVIISAPAMQSGDKNWTDPGPVGFKAELAFGVTKEQNAELILSEDMPEMINPDTDERGPARSVRIPVVLLPPRKVTALFRPEKAILELDERFHAAVEPADFPQHTIRWRNQRWADEVGFGGLSDVEWADHFGKFAPLTGSLEKPLALAYHGHQFQVYNPQIGDGRGFLFAQLRDGEGRLLDLGTKGSGQTPWSRSGDGRLTLKGGVREIMAASMLEALGVYTSKAFSLIETGEQLARNDEPSPTRSSVLVRLSHSHIRFGTFQRQAYAGDADAIGKLVEYCIRHYHPAAAGADMAASAAGLLREIVAATAELAASWMSAGFVHGVLNTDNMVVTGESFDYGPWRFLPYSDPSFTAAYFDETGLYAFGRQPSVALWNLGQLAQCLTLVCDVPPLEKELERYEGIYRAAFPRRVLAVLGLQSAGEGADLELLKTLFGWLGETKAAWPQVFFDWFGGQASEARAAASPLAKLYAAPGFEPVRRALLAHAPERPERLAHPYFQEASPVSLVIEEVEALWAHIAERDDWGPFNRHMARIEAARQALDLIPVKASKSSKSG